MKKQLLKKLEDTSKSEVLDLRMLQRQLALKIATKIDEGLVFPSTIVGRALEFVDGKIAYLIASKFVVSLFSKLWGEDTVDINFGQREREIRDKLDQLIEIESIESITDELALQITRILMVMMYGDSYKKYRESQLETE